MADDKRRKVDDTISELDLRLDGLLGKLGQSLGEMIERLESGEAQELRRSHDVETPHGPVRAEAGLRVRLAGVGRPGGKERAPSQRRQPRPKGQGGAAEARDDRRAGAAAPASAPAQAAPDPSPRKAETESYESDGRWHVCADLPGVSLPEIDVSVAPGPSAGDERRLRVLTEGARRYLAEEALPDGADPSNMEIALRNGVLVISMDLQRADGGETS